MAIKVGINGFGRIGRVALRCMVERGSNSYQICGINLRNADLDYMVYQVKYDSVFRTFTGHRGARRQPPHHQRQEDPGLQLAPTPPTSPGMTAGPSTSSSPPAPTLPRSPPPPT